MSSRLFRAHLLLLDPLPLELTWPGGLPCLSGKVKALAIARQRTRGGVVYGLTRALQDRPVTPQRHGPQSDERGL